MSSHFDLDAADWATLRRLLDDALDRAPDERATFVDTLGAEYDGFKPRLRALLSHAASTRNALDTLPKIDAAVETAQFAPPRPSDAAPPTIGPYRLLRQLGAGGMGTVWLAERTDMLQKRHVAIKLARSSGTRAELAARLAREREIVATLNHPNIARLYDAGLIANDGRTSDAGQPYLVFEYVEGVRIDHWCRDRQLDVAGRLRLLLQVVRAIAHAHANLVVHRDIKPTNILVDADGQAKLLDFGIAKLVESGQADETELTQFGGRALTPDYASPEQILGAPISTASDIYSLGVVMYELLADARPYSMRRESRAALEKAILETEPVRPSDAATAPALRRALRGELDTVVLKAMKKRRAERYATADALADDIERHLDGRPVLAQPDSAVYRLRKFAGRHRVAVAAGTAVMLAIFAGTGAALWQARLAVAEQRRAEEVKDFIASIFRDADPWRGPQARLSVAELLQRAHARVDERTSLGTETRIELLNTLGGSFLGVQEFAAAEKVQRQAIGEAERALGAAHPQTVRARALLLDVLGSQGRSAEVSRELGVLLPVLEADEARFPGELASALLAKVGVELDEGRYADMEATARRMIDVAQRRLGPAHESRMLAERALANALENQRRLDDAVRHSAQAYELAQRLYADRPRHPTLVDTRFIHARILARTGRNEPAIALMEQSIADVTEVLGPDNHRVGTYARTMIAPLVARGELKRARAVGERAFAILGRHFADDSIHLAYARVANGSVLLAMREAAPAVAMYARASDVVTGALGPVHAYALHVRMNAALARAYAGDRSAVAELGRVADEHGARGYPNLADALRLRAQSLRLHGDAAGARQAIDAAFAQARTEKLDAGALVRFDAESGLIAVDEGRHDAALALLDRAAQALRKAEPTMTPAQADLAVGAGRAQLAAGRPKACIDAVLPAVTFWREFDAASPWSGEAAYWLARCRAEAADAAAPAAPAALAAAMRLLKGSPLPQHAQLIRTAGVR